MGLGMYLPVNNAPSQRDFLAQMITINLEIQVKVASVRLAIPTMRIGSLIIAIIAAMHSGMMDDAPKKNALTDEDIGRLAEAMTQAPGEQK
jgi:hypothetical protein